MVAGGGDGGGGGGVVEGECRRGSDFLQIEITSNINLSVSDSPHLDLSRSSWRLAVAACTRTAWRT